MLTLDTRHEILAALVGQLDGYQFPQPWAFLPPHDDVRSLPAEPERLLAALEAEYPIEALIAARIAEADGEGRLRIAARLATPGRPVVVLRDRRSRAVLDLLTEAGSLLGDDLPIFTALAGQCVTLYRNCGQRHVLAAMSLEDVAVLRACGIPATLATGLDELHPADVERLCAAFHLERDMSPRLEDTTPVFLPPEMLMSPATTPAASEPTEHVPVQAESSADESEDGEAEVGEADDAEPENDETRSCEPNDSQTEDSQTEDRQTEDGQPEDGQPEDSQPEGSRAEAGQAEAGQTVDSQRPGPSEPETHQPDTCQPDTCQPEADPPEADKLQKRLILVGWSPATLSPEPSARFHAVVRHFGELEQFMRVDFSDVGVWRPTPEEIGRVRFFLRYAAAESLQESLLDSIYENALPLEFNRQQPGSPAIDSSQLPSALRELAQAFEAATAGYDGSQSRQEALRRFERVLFEEVVEPMLSETLSGADGVEQATGMAVAQLLPMLVTEGVVINAMVSKALALHGTAGLNAIPAQAVKQFLSMADRLTPMLRELRECSESASGGMSVPRLR